MPGPTPRDTCESCKSIDVRRWHREGWLRAGQDFSCSWTYGGKPFGSISVRTEAEAVVLVFSSRRSEESDWKPVEQRVPITWTACHLGGERAWFVCSVYADGRYCGRRAALLYGAGEFFACRRCYGLAYASQQESPGLRKIRRSRNIRTRLGGSANLCEPFPEKPKRMHWQTYHRLRRRHDAAEARSSIGLTQFIDRLGRRTRWLF